MCFGVAIICWAIQKGDAAVDPSPSWKVGAFWYSLATALTVGGVWLWNQTANRHIILRGFFTLAACTIAFGMFYRPVRHQWEREHMISQRRSTSPGAPTGAPIAGEGEKAASPPKTMRPVKREAGTTMPPRSKVTIQPEVSSQNGTAVGTVTAQPGAVVSIGQQGGVTAGTYIGSTPPERHLSGTQTAQLEAFARELPESANKWLSVEHVADDESSAFAREIYGIFARHQRVLPGPVQWLANPDPDARGVFVCSIRGGRRLWLCSENS